MVEVVRETEDTCSIVLERPAGSGDLFVHRPGQFLTVGVPSERTGLVARCYSLSSMPDDETLTITVRRTESGYASTWLCTELAPGDTLLAQPPSGIFTPDSLDDDLLLLAAGSGITPVMSILRTALARGSGHVVLLHAGRDEASLIFGDAVAALASEHPARLRVERWLESERGLPGVADVVGLARPYAAYDSFCCGPAPFMKVVAEALKQLGLPRARRHQERFVSLGANPFGDVVPGG